MFFYYRNPAVLICWTMGQQAFNASMILILDAWETDNDRNEWLINEAYAVFVQLEDKGVHKLAQLAVQRISDGLLQLEGRRMEQQQALAMSSRRMTAQEPSPSLTLDTASMTDWSADTVMGNTGMFLLEDPGLQAYHQPSFHPLGWNMAGSAHPSHLSNPSSPRIPTIPVSQVAVAPFPVMSPPFVGSAITGISSPYAVGLQPRLQSLHPRRTTASRQTPQQPLYQPAEPRSNFTPINPAGTLPLGQQHQLSPDLQSHALHPQPQSFSQLRGPRHTSHSHRHHRGALHTSSGGSGGSSSSSKHSAGGGPRGVNVTGGGVHKPDRPVGSARSQPRARK